VRELAVVPAVLLLGRVAMWSVMSSIKSSSGLESERKRSGV
jgi:hypothetical protein